MKELVIIQTELKAPKSQFNTFGKYSYRSCEDIVEAAKPLLAKTNCTLTITDEIVVFGTPFSCTDYINVGTDKAPDYREIQTTFGERFFVKATATLTNSTGEHISVTAYAELPIDRKGMDPAQVTGASSSYARKYALNGLFAIDDCKDPDATNDHGVDRNEKQQRPSAPKTPVQPEDKKTKTLKFMAALKVSKADIETLFGMKIDDFRDKEFFRLRKASELIVQNNVDFRTAVRVAHNVSEEEISAALGCNFCDAKNEELKLVARWFACMRDLNMNFDDAVAEVGK